MISVMIPGELQEVTVLYINLKYQPCVYLCASQTQTLEQAHETKSAGFCEAPRVVAAKTDRERHEPIKLFAAFLLDNSLVVLLENNLTTPVIDDMLIDFVNEIIPFSVDL